MSRPIVLSQVVFTRNMAPPTHGKQAWDIMARSRRVVKGLEADRASGTSDRWRSQNRHLKARTGSPNPETLRFSLLPADLIDPRAKTLQLRRELRYFGADDFAREAVHNSV